MMGDVVLVLAGFAAGVIVSQLGLVALVFAGRRLLRRRGRHGPPPPGPETGTVGATPLVDRR